MNNMPRMVAPAGMPVSILDLFKIAWSRLASENPERAFAETIKEVSGASYCRFINSGRAADYLILKSLRDISASSKNEVVIPAYTCYSVPASIIRAGLKVRLVDIVPETMDYDFNQLGRMDLSNTLAVLPTNLFGIICDWASLRRAVKEKNIYFVDDSAQTFGLSSGGVNCGLLGDIGFYSFGRGKNLTTYSGGAIVTNDPQLAEQIDLSLKELPSPGLPSEIKLFAELAFYAIMLRPWLYWIPDRLPFLGLGKTLYDPNFSVSNLSPLQLAIGPIVYEKYSRINSVRNENANKLASQISKFANFSVPAWRINSNIPFIRLPILASDKTNRDKAIGKLHAVGIAASAMYPSTINSIPEITENLVNVTDKFPGAKAVAERLFTLPTHPYLNSHDIKTIISCLAEI
jgi:perosamine synthetase